MTDEVGIPKQPALYALLQRLIQEYSEEPDPSLDADRLELERSPIRFREIEETKGDGHELDHHR